MSKQIPRDGRPIHYRLQYIKCPRKEICRTCKNGKGHGPYWYAEWQEKGKQVRKYCGKGVPRTKQVEKEMTIQQQEEGEPISELLVTELLSEQIKLLEHYQIFVEPIWIKETLYSNLILPNGSVHRADPSRSPNTWIIILPGGTRISYHRPDHQSYPTLGAKR